MSEFVNAVVFRNVGESVGSVFCCVRRGKEVEGGRGGGKMSGHPVTEQEGVRKS